MIEEDILRSVVHYTMHFLAIGAIAYTVDARQWKKIWYILLATMLVDLDHLLATPIFDADRCSIGFHPLHSYYAITLYLAMLFIPYKTAKIVAIGLLFHMLTDYLDCVWMRSINGL